MQNNNNKPANSARKSRGPSRQNGKKASKEAGPSSKGLRSQAPAAIGRSIKSSKPRERAGPNGSRLITFREYVQDIAGAVAFTATSYPVQPGISTLFAWLSEQAISYQEYVFRKLRFCYQTEKSSAISGKVMFAFYPDAADGNPASKQEMLENMIKGGNVVWNEFSMDVPMVEALGRRRYVRSGDLAANLDLKTYDLGKLVVAVQGMADATDVGELYVEYEIELFTPVLSVAANAYARSAVVTAGGTVSKTALFGTAATVVGGLNVTALGDVLTFNRVGRYILTLNVTGTGLTQAFAPTLTSPSGGASANVFGTGNLTGSTGTQAVLCITCTVVSRGTTLTIACTSLATTITACVAEVASFSSSSA